MTLSVNVSYREWRLTISWGDRTEDISAPMDYPPGLTADEEDRWCVAALEKEAARRMSRYADNAERGEPPRVSIECREIGHWYEPAQRESWPDRTCTVEDMPESVPDPGGA